MVATSIAWNWMTFGLSFIFLGVVLIMLTFAFNQLIDTSNTDITNGIETGQQIAVMAQIQLWWTFMPWIILLVGFIAMVIGAIENKGSSA